MSSKYKFKDQDKLYFVTFAVINWIDLFIRNEYKDILLASWQYCKAEKGMDLYAWVIMTSHVHMIVGTNNEPMENILRDMKKYTSGALRKAINEHYGESRKEWMLSMMETAGKQSKKDGAFQLWQYGNHPVELRNPAIMHQKLDYIHNNPVKAGIVEKPEDYLYSSARDYHGFRGLIEITMIEPMII